jgi:pyruvate dehydrogenase E1 component alpha subunit
MEDDTMEEEKFEKDEKKTMVSRRSFLKGMAAAGVGAAFFSSALEKTAEAVGGMAPGYFPAELSNDKLIDMYDRMLKIRWFERTWVDARLTVKGWRGGAHPSQGQEAGPVGVCSALRDDDYVFGNHRSHGHCIAKGAPLKGMMAELDFRANGLNKGFGGTMHIVYPEKGMMGADGIVGPGAVFASGAAYGIKVRGTDQVAVVFGGDGQANTPFFHIAMNEAANFNLPFIYVIENNMYQIWVRYTQTTNLIDLADRAKGYGMPGVVVDGMDVLAVYTATKEAVDRARAGKGPTLIEAKTYRYHDHGGTAGSKPGRLGAFGLDYRPDSEVRAWMAKDPIVRQRNMLVNNGILTEEEADAIEAKVKNELKEAFEYALASPMCTPEDGLKNVYAEGSVPIRQFLA